MQGLQSVNGPLGPLLQASERVLATRASARLYPCAAGADPCLATASGETPVTFAAQTGALGTLRRLVEAGGGAALAMRGGRLQGCPLHYATEHAPLETVQFLIDECPAGAWGRCVCRGGEKLRVIGWELPACEPCLRTAPEHRPHALRPRTHAAAAVKDANSLLPVGL